MRILFLLLALAAAAPASAQPRYLHAVEFPYYLYPRSLWERELVWLKTIGVRTVAFSIPWNWHQPDRAEPDFTGRTSPRRDLMGFVRLLRRLELRAWVRPLPPLRGWVNSGYPLAGGQDRRALREWTRQLGHLLEPQTVAHGGPIEFAEGTGVLDVPAPPSPVVTLPATEAGALAHSRQVLATARGSLLWQDVENALWPAGWAAPGAPIIRRGAVGLNGTEQPTAAALRREAGLLKNWEPLVSAMRPHTKPAVRPVTGKFPAGVTASELVSRVASAVSVVNRSGQPYRGDLRVYDPLNRRAMVITGVAVPAGEALWLPLRVSLAGGGLCRDCSGFASTEHIVYSTLELQALEFENGILAMEFAAPVAGDVVLQLARRPSGPFLAAGRLTKFDFDEKALRARLPVPAGEGPTHRVRIGLAIEPPEMSAFFVDAKRLVIGQSNAVKTSYSSEQLAVRSRLRLPEGFTAKPVKTSPMEIDYELAVPSEALHGDWANLAIEADGVLLGRARLQLLRPASVRLTQAINLHFGEEELLVEPPLAALDPKAGRNLDITIRNNSPQIRTYKLEAAGDGLQFFPPATEISIGAIMERAVSFRVFADDGRGGLRDWRLRISGGATLDLPMRLVLVPRGRTVTWSADLDGDGAPEWVIENQRVRAVFSSQDGGRWMEFVWKDSGLNLLPENGALAGVGRAIIREQEGPRLVMVTGTGTRTVTLGETGLVLEQDRPLPPEVLKTEKRNELTLHVTRESATRAVYEILTAPRP